MPAYNTYMPQYGGYQAPYYMPQYQQQMAQPQTAMPQMSPAQMPGTSQQAVQSAPAASATPITNMIWVGSEKDATMQPVVPNSAIALWDSNNPVVYVKKADVSGKPSMQIFDLVERVEKSAEASSAPSVDLSAYAPKSDVLTLAGALDSMRGDIDSIKDELASLAAQAVKRAVGAKTKKGEEDE